MTNNIFEQLNEAYSRWSLLDKVGKEIQLEGMWQQVSAAYNYLSQVYQSRGFLTQSEADYANRISQILVALQNQKIQVDQELACEMMKHLVKMKAKL